MLHNHCTNYAEKESHSFHCFTVSLTLHREILILSRARILKSEPNQGWASGWVIFSFFTRPGNPGFGSNILNSGFLEKSLSHENFIFPTYKFCSECAYELFGLVYFYLALRYHWKLLNRDAIRQGHTYDTDLSPLGVTGKVSPLIKF